MTKPLLSVTIFIYQIKETPIPEDTTTMNANQTPKAVKRLEDGSFAVQYKGKRKWFIIKKEDELFFQFIVSWMIKHEEA